MLPAIFWIAGMGIFRSLIVKGVVLIGALVQIYGCSQNFIDFYVLYYRTPYTVPNALAFYSQEDMAPRMFKLERFSPDGQMQPVSFATLIAPLNDSIYVPQNSQWYRYVEMWNEGYTDNLWLRWLQRARDREPEVN